MVAVTLLLPQPALAGDLNFVPSVMTLGSMALAIAASLWAISANNTAGRLRRAIREIESRWLAAVSARDAVIEAGRERVLVWGHDLNLTRSYKGSEELLEACLAGPDALLLSQALDDLGNSGASFALHARIPTGEAVRVRGRAIAGLAALWLDREVVPVVSVTRDVHSVLDALPMPVWLRDRSLALTWVNRAFVETVDVPDTATAIGMQNTLEKSERDLASAARAEDRRMEGKRYIILNGQRRAIALTSTPLLDGSILGVAIDVTELSNAEAKLQQHLDAHADTLDKLATAVAIFDSDQRLSFHNHAFTLLWGLSEEWLESRPSDGDVLDRLREVRKLPEQRDYQAWKRNRLATYHQANQFLPEDQWHLPDGKTLRVVAQRHPFGGLAYLYEDITERLSLESSYNTLIRVQRATLDTLSEGVAVFGPNGRLKLHNAAFARLWQLEESDITGEPHVQSVGQACVQRFGEECGWQKLVANVSSGSERCGEWGHIERSDGTIVAVAFAPLPDGATLVTFADVTDRFRIETALRERNEALLAADKLKSDFVQHASFLFRDPLNAVQGFADLLAGGHAGALTAKQADYVHNILAASHHLAEITSDILDLAMIESGNMLLELDRVDVFGLLTRAADSLRQHAASLDIAFTLAVSPDIGIAVLDERRIRQVVFNLLSNAFKYTPRGGAIVLGAQIAGDDVQIYVSDSGPGIAADFQARAFDRFEAKGRAGIRAGAGLGLALVNSFVELHDGWVEIETGEGHGTLVRCHLPRRFGEKAPVSKEGTQAA